MKVDVEFPADMAQFTLELMKILGEERAKTNDLLHRVQKLETIVDKVIDLQYQVARLNIR